MAAWVPIREAADRLGVSEDTIRRRLRARKLRGKPVRTPQGFTWQIRLDAPTAPAAAPAGAEASASADAEAPPPQPPPSLPPQGPPHSPGQDGQAAAGAAGAEAVRRLEAHVGDLRAQLGRLGEELEARRQEQAGEREAHRREVQQLHTLLAQAQHLALPAPLGAPTSREATPVAPAPAEAAAPAEAPAAAESDGEAMPPQSPPRLPWWRRLFSWDGAEAGAEAARRWWQRRRWG
jgi:hypothetical protein